MQIRTQRSVIRLGPNGQFVPGCYGVERFLANLPGYDLHPLVEILSNIVPYIRLEGFVQGWSIRKQKGLFAGGYFGGAWTEMDRKGRYRRAHNLKVRGSNPLPATNFIASNQ